MIPGKRLFLHIIIMNFYFLGVVETGLFVNMISKAYFGNHEGKVEIKTNSTLSS
jgi:hypothetical protein